MTKGLVVSQDAIVVLRVRAYQRRAARAAAIAASSCRLKGVDLCCGENGHCDISQVQTQVENARYGRCGEIVCLRPAFH